MCNIQVCYLKAWKPKIYLWFFFLTSTSNPLTSPLRYTLNYIQNPSLLSIHTTTILIQASILSIVDNYDCVLSDPPALSFYGLFPHNCKNNLKVIYIWLCNFPTLTLLWFLITPVTQLRPLVMTYKACMIQLLLYSLPYPRPLIL